MIIKNFHGEEINKISLESHCHLHSPLTKIKTFTGPCLMASFCLSASVEMIFSSSFPNLLTELSLKGILSIKSLNSSLDTSSFNWTSDSAVSLNVSREPLVLSLPNLYSSTIPLAYSFMISNSSLLMEFEFSNATIKSRFSAIPEHSKLKWNYRQNKK